MSLSFLFEYHARTYICGKAESSKKRLLSERKKEVTATNVMRKNTWHHPIKLKSNQSMQKLVPSFSERPTQTRTE